MNDLNSIAVLFDGDNTQEIKAELVLREVSKYGKIVVKRAYGNWKKESLKNWEDAFRELAIKPIYQIDYVKGKNATDMSLTIDAMDFLYTANYDGFAIVSSDSDFTPLAIKLKEAGKFVIGIGNKQTSSAFINSCNEFIYCENLSVAEAEEIDESPASQEEPGKIAGDADTKKPVLVTRRKNKDAELRNLLRTAWETWQDDAGYCNVSSAGSYINRVKPDFDITEFGFAKLPEYIKAFPDLYEVIEYQGKGTVKIIAFKLKGKRR